MAGWGRRGRGELRWPDGGGVEAASCCGRGVGRGRGRRIRLGDAARSWRGHRGWDFLRPLRWCFFFFYNPSGGIECPALRWCFPFSPPPFLPLSRAPSLSLYALSPDSPAVAPPHQFSSPQPNPTKNPRIASAPNPPPSIRQFPAPHRFWCKFAFFFFCPKRSGSDFNLRYSPLNPARLVPVRPPSNPGHRNRIK